MKTLLSKLLEAEKILVEAQKAAFFIADQPTQEKLRSLVINLLDIAAPIAEIAENISEEYTEGKYIQRIGSIYKIERVYDLTDEYMKEHNLYYRKRVTLIKVSGENGIDREDFALPNQEMTFF